MPAFEPDDPMLKLGLRNNVQGRKWAYAKRMRRNLTPAELKLDKALSGRKIGGHKFRKQVILLGWIADFYSADCRLVVEVDGPYHAERVAEDKLRDAILLKSRGILTLRFTNDDVMNNWRYVLGRIRHVADERCFQSHSRDPKQAAIEASNSGRWGKTHGKPPST